jgi:hypothetical protein
MAINRRGIEKFVKILTKFFDRLIKKRINSWVCTELHRVGNIIEDEVSDLHCFMQSYMTDEYSRIFAQFYLGETKRKIKIKIRQIMYDHDLISWE